MTDHYVDIYPEKGAFSVSCLCTSFYKKFPTRAEARMNAHLHIAGVDIDLLELALAGKDGND